MVIQFQLQHLAVGELKLELLAIERRIVPMDDAVVVGADDYDVGGVVVLRIGKVVNMMCLYYAIAVFAANLLASYLVAIIIVFLKHLDDAAIYLTVLNQAFFLLNRRVSVCHEEFIVISGFIYLLWNSIQRTSQLLIVLGGIAFYTQHVRF